MSRREPMHVNPGHPMWVRIPLACAVLLLVMAGGYAYSVAVHGDSPAWAGVILAPLAAVFCAWVAWDIRKEQRNA